MAALSDTVMQVADCQSVAISGSSASSTAINGTGAFAIVNLNSTTNCHIAFGSSPTASTTWAAGERKFRLTAGENYCFKLNSGEKVAVIQEAASGTLYISRME